MVLFIVEMNGNNSNCQIPPNPHFPSWLFLLFFKLMANVIRVICMVPFRKRSHVDEPVCASWPLKMRLSWEQTGESASSAGSGSRSHFLLPHCTLPCTPPAHSSHSSWRPPSPSWLRARCTAPDMGVGVAGGGGGMKCSDLSLLRRVVTMR